MYLSLWCPQFVNQWEHWLGRLGSFYWTGASMSNNRKLYLGKDHFFMDVSTTNKIQPPSILSDWTLKSHSKNYQKYFLSLIWHETYLYIHSCVFTAPWSIQRNNFDPINQRTSDVAQQSHSSGCEESHNCQRQVQTRTLSQCAVFNKNIAERVQWQLQKKKKKKFL